MTDEQGFRVKMRRFVTCAVLITLLVSLVIYLGYLVMDFRQSLHEIPN